MENKKQKPTKKKEFKLHKRWEFLRFFKKSELFKTPECIVYRIPNDCGIARIGITLKARTNSVNRNRVRRQIRETFRRHQERLGNYDYNIVVPAIKKIEYPYPKRLKQALEELFLRIAKNV